MDTILLNEILQTNKTLIEQNETIIELLQSIKMSSEHIEDITGRIEYK